MKSLSLMSTDDYLYLDTSIYPIDQAKSGRFSFFPAPDLINFAKIVDSTFKNIFHI